jgi:geranylgeranyl diphosphate synthase type II
MVLSTLTPMPAAGPADSFEEHCRKLRQLVEDALLENTAYDSSSGGHVPTRLAEAIRHSLFAPAKRLRPLLVLLACEACGSDPGRALPAACAVEMIHTYSLIHDDLPAMDNDDLRRGRPTCHKAFGEATAILAGDALLAQAFEVLARQLPAAIAAPCVAEIAIAAGPKFLVGGQQDDLHPEAIEPTLAGLERIHRRKTGALISVSLWLGGMVAEAGDEAIRSLGRYGECLGLAFQIVDDLLDLNGDESKMGKKAGKDSGAGKLTYPGLMGETASRQWAAELIAQATDALQVFGPRGAHLEALARYVLERNH